MAKAPVNRILSLSAVDNARLLGVIGGIALLLVLFYDYRISDREHHRYFSGKAFPAYMGVVIIFIGSAGYWIHSRIGRRKLESVRQGDYLAHWELSPEQWLVYRESQKVETLSKLKTIFWVLTIGFGLLGLAGAVAAFIYDRPFLTLFKIFLGGLGLGFLIWLVCALPVKLLFQSHERIAARPPHEIFFLEDSIYSTGRILLFENSFWVSFVSGVRPLTDAEKSLAPDLEGILYFHAVRRINSPGREPGQTTDLPVNLDFPVPIGQGDTARALAEHYLPEGFRPAQEADS